MESRIQYPEWKPPRMPSAGRQRRRPGRSRSPKLGAPRSRRIKRCQNCYAAATGAARTVALHQRAAGNGVPRPTRYGHISHRRRNRAFAYVRLCSRMFAYVRLKSLMFVYFEKSIFLAWSSAGAGTPQVVACRLENVGCAGGNGINWKC